MITMSATLAMWSRGKSHIRTYHWTEFVSGSSVVTKMAVASDQKTVFIIMTSKVSLAGGLAQSVGFYCITLSHWHIPALGCVNTCLCLKLGI